MKPGGQRRDLRRLLGNRHLPELVEVRQLIAGRVLFPVLGVTHHRHVIGRHELLHLERSAADRHLRHVGCRIERNDPRVDRAEHHRKVGVRIGEMEHDRIRRRRLDLLHETEQAATHRRRLRIEQPVNRELDVLRRELTAVMELDAATNVERPALAVVGDFPIGGESRLRIQLRIDADQVVEDRRTDDELFVRAVNRRIEPACGGRYREFQLRRPSSVPLARMPVCCQVFQRRLR